MATPKSAKDMKDQIARMAAPQGGAEAAPQAPPQPQPTGKPKEDTEGDAITSKLAPKNEGTASTDDPAISYDIEFDGVKRKLSPEQIASTFKRYQSANTELTDLAPILELAKSMLKGGKGTPAQLADFIKGALVAKSNEKLQLGNTRGEEGGRAPRGRDDSPRAMSDMHKWMEENDLTSAPPGLEEMGGLRGELQEMRQMMQMVLRGNRANSEATESSMAEMKARQTQMTQQRIAQNLNDVQSSLGLNDDTAEDFFQFAAERGFVTEDFVNPQLVQNIALDFKNNLDSPELERLKGIHARRQAFTGISSPSPSGQTPGGGAPSRLDRMAASVPRLPQ